MKARRIALLAAAVAVAIVGAFMLWSPGLALRDGRHDRGANAAWLQHGWLATDEWFSRNGGPERAASFRESARLAELADLMRQAHVTDLFPHAGPANEQGVLPGLDDAQAERFLDAMGAGMRVMPWIGANRDRTGHVEDPAWRASFVRGAADMIAKHPRLAGVHVNIEPCRDGDPSMLALLDELRAAMPAGKMLSVSAYPPFSWMRPFPDVQWGESYAREIASRCDQMAFMMYDTGLRSKKMYRHLMATWTRQELERAGHAKVLLGVPTYDDPGVAYHVARVENLHQALLGIHEGLAGFSELPPSYQGVAIYCEWETSPDEWKQWREEFAAR